MFLSDELIEIGRKAKKNNNMLMGAQEVEMMDRLHKAAEDHTMKQLVNITKLVCETLNKEGYKYYNVGHFFVVSREGSMK